MTTTLKAGTRLRSAVCSTEVVLIRIDDPATPVLCGGAPMNPVAPDAPAPQGAPLAGFDGGTLLGKRYGDTGDPVEVLCTKPGTGSLSVGDHVLAERRAKPLPASD